MAFSFPLATIKRGHHLHGLGMMGDVNPTGMLAAGTPIEYYIPSYGEHLHAPTQEEMTAVANGIRTWGVTIPLSNVRVRMVSNNDGFIFNSWAVDIQGTLTQNVPSFDALASMLASVLMDVIGATVNNPGTFLQQGTSPMDLGAAASPGVPSGTAPRNAASFGIDSVLGYPANDGSDFDIIFTDGSSGIFDAEGQYYSGTQDGVTEVGNLESDSGTQIGYFVLLNDGTELYFDLNGAYTDSNLDYSGGTSTSGGATQIIRTGTNPAGTPPAPKPAGYDWSKIVNSLGLSGLMAALGIGAGTTLIVAGVGLYVFMNGFPGSKRR